MLELIYINANWSLSMNYTEKIKTVRKSLLLTQEELPVEIGVTPITVCRWETGKVEPSIKAKKAIRDLCEREDLLLGDKNG